MVAADSGLPQQIVEEVLDSLERASNEIVINEGELKLLDLITINTRVLPPRRAMDISTRQYVQLPECKTLKAKVNRKLMRSFKSGVPMDDAKQPVDGQYYEDPSVEDPDYDVGDVWPDDPLDGLD